MNWRRLRTAIDHRLALLRPRGSWAPALKDAKEQWSTEAPTHCPNAPHVYEAVSSLPMRRILEFGANTGGNLTYFLDRHPEIEAVGIDINPIVKTPEEQYPGYRGAVGDESVLASWAPDSFDLAFTVSVLDHIPAPAVVEATLRSLVELAPTVVLLEPVIAGVHGDVSGRIRGEVAANLPAPHKRFAAHCYIWDYDRWLSRLPVTWTRRALPLHAASLGPFYHLYVITRQA